MKSCLKVLRMLAKIGPQNTKGKVQFHIDEPMHVYPPPPMYKLRPCPSYSRWQPVAELSAVYGQATAGVGTVLILYRILIPDQT